MMFVRLGNDKAPAYPIGEVMRNRMCGKAIGGDAGWGLSDRG